MEFYENQLFHIYNQGNNRRQIFFSDENYKFFLWKMRAYLMPFGDLVCWCLMPNHFHWLFYVRYICVERSTLRENVDKVEFQRRIHKYGKNAQIVDRAYVRTSDRDELISLNHAIGDLQKGYTRAINKENNWTGSLFREKCKTKDGWIDEFVTVKKSGKEDSGFSPGSDYGFYCFCYIHDNPKQAGLVEHSIDYPWSSARDYEGLRKGSLCNLEMGRQLQGFM